MLKQLFKINVYVDRQIFFPNCIIIINCITHTNCYNLALVILIARIDVGFSLIYFALMKLFTCFVSLVVNYSLHSYHQNKCD
jgi:hypothetical protein